MFVVLIIVTGIVAVLFAQYEEQDLWVQYYEKLKAWMMSDEAQRLRAIDPEAFQREKFFIGTC